MWNPHSQWWHTLISSINVNAVGRSGAWLSSHAQEEGFTCRWCVFPVQNCCSSEVLELSLAAELALKPFWGQTQRGREHAQCAVVFFFSACCFLMLARTFKLPNYFGLLCSAPLPALWMPAARGEGGWRSRRLISSCWPFSLPSRRLQALHLA